MTYYDGIAGSYKELYGEEQINKLNIIKKNIKISKSTKILDVGCGTGISSGFKCFIVGVDPSSESLRQNKSIRVMSIAEALPFKDNIFDYVISITAIHNFTDIRKSIEEMLRVGKHNFVLTVLKKSKKFDSIKRLIEKKFMIDKMMEEDKDVIFFCHKTVNYKPTITNYNL